MKGWQHLIYTQAAAVAVAVLRRAVIMVARLGLETEAADEVSTAWLDICDAT